jgi:pyruvate formate lyase activating enzyme
MTIPSQATPMQWYEHYANGITCLLCEQYCFLTPGKSGICGNQRNDEGVLTTVTYGRPSALSITHIEERPFLHVTPGANALALGTAGCNLFCPGCQNHELTQHYEQIEAMELQPEQVVKLALEHHLPAIAFGYNEPVVYYPYARDIGVIARDKGIKLLFQTAAMASPYVIEDLPRWVDAVHADLKSFNPAYYKSVLGGSLCAVKENLRALARSGVWLEVTTLVINGVNDSVDELDAIARFIAEELGTHVPWHVSAFTPANYRLSHPATSTSALLRAYEAGRAAGLHYVYFGNVPWLNETRCPGCDALLVQRHEYDILENHIADGGCPHCGRRLEGVWK